MLIRMNAYSLNRKMPKMYSVWDLARCIVAVVLAMLPSMSFAQFPLPQTPEATRIAARTIPNAGDTIPLISENEASDSSETSVVTADSEPTTPPTPPKEEELFVAARVIAVVGEERVLLGDMVPPSVLNKMSISNPAFEANLRKGLASSIEQKCLAQHFINMQTAGKPSKERNEIRSKINAKTAEIFRTKVLPEQMVRAKCETELEFIEGLEKSGRSLEWLKRSFAEQMWAQQALGTHVQDKPTVELHEMQDYYDAHPDLWNKPSRARFRILSATFKATPDRDTAYAEIVNMGNQVYFGGSFEAVAKTLSKGFGASDGGTVDWVSPGSLKSKVIEEAAFSIELKALSQILEDTEGFHIIEVLEREDAYTMTFPQAQAEIRKQLTKDKREKQREDQIRKIREITPVWTMWPEDIPGSKDLKEIQ
jgi:hypothetical protein